MRVQSYLDLEITRLGHLLKPRIEERQGIFIDGKAHHLLFSRFELHHLDSELIPGDAVPEQFGNGNAG